MSRLSFVKRNVCPISDPVCSTPFVAVKKSLLRFLDGAIKVPRCKRSSLPGHFPKRGSLSNRDWLSIPYPPLLLRPFPNYPSAQASAPKLHFPRTRIINWPRKTGKKTALEKGHGTIYIKSSRSELSTSCLFFPPFWPLIKGFLDPFSPPPPS